MPGGDRTGPMGMGPMTGRAAGYCAGYPAPGFMNPYGGRGFGGRGGGRGWRHGYYATGLPGWGAPAWGAPAAGWGIAPWAPTVPGVAPTTEIEALKAQAEYLENSLGEIQKRVQELESQEQKES